MSTFTKSTKLHIFLLLCFFSITNYAAKAAGGLTLYTPYTRISVPPGQSIDYSIDVINKSGEVKNVNFLISGLPKGWTFDLKSGGWNISQLSVLPGEKKSISLRVQVPLKVNKGNYQFRVVAEGLYTLSLDVIVSEQGTYKTEFTTDQPNMEGSASSTFSFKATLKNETADEQLYALRAQVGRGWNVTFKANYKAVTSVSINANGSQQIDIDVTAPEDVEAGKYKIPISAETSSTSADLQLEVVVTGTYNIELTTPTGLLSTNVTAGEQKRVELVVKNTGSSQLKDINMSFNAPVNWDVTFDPKKIVQLDPAATTHVFATIKADKKAIPGDYVTQITAKTPEKSSEISFRVSVETGLLWGWIGVLIIIAAAASVYYLFRKYGRR